MIMSCDIHNTPHDDDDHDAEKDNLMMKSRTERVDWIIS